MEPWMTAYDTCRYRGYHIVPRLEWSKWCVAVYPTRPDLPILSRSTLPLPSYRQGRGNRGRHSELSIKLFLPLGEWLD